MMMSSLYEVRCLSCGKIQNNCEIDKQGIITDGDQTTFKCHLCGRGAPCKVISGGISQDDYLLKNDSQTNLYSIKPKIVSDNNNNNNVKISQKTENIIENRRLFICQNCKKSFILNNLLKKYMDLKIGDLTKVRCPFCKNNESIISYFVKGEGIDLEIARDIGCYDCMKGTKNYFLKQMLGNLPKNERFKYLCPKCGKKDANLVLVN